MRFRMQFQPFLTVVGECNLLLPFEKTEVTQGEARFNFALHALGRFATADLFGFASAVNAHDNPPCSTVFSDLNAHCTSLSRPLTIASTSTGASGCIR